MGLLDKTEHIQVTIPRSGGLLDKATTVTTKDVDYTSSSDEIVKKKASSFKEFIQSARNLIDAFESEKTGLLFSTKDYFIPFLLSGYDKTTLNKLRLKTDVITKAQTCLKKEELKTVISLREFLSEDSRDFYFVFPSNRVKNLLCMFRDLSDVNMLKNYQREIGIVASELEFMSTYTAQSVIYFSEEEIRPHLLTAELESMCINIFTFSYSDFINLLGLPLDYMQELFLLHVINTIIVNTFQRSAFSLKTGDTIKLYFISVSNQNPSLLKHQINRTLVQYFLGSDAESVEIVHELKSE